MTAEETARIILDPLPFLEFYRRSDPVIRRFFIEGLIVAANGKAEGPALRLLMERRIKENVTGITAKLDPGQLNGLYYRLSSIDSMSARYILGVFFDRGAGVAEDEIEQDFDLLDEDDIERLPDTAPLIHADDPGKCIIPQESIGVLVAPPKTGKSFLALSWTLAIANGSEWIGHQVEGGPAVYLTGGEGLAGWRKRIRAAKKHMGIDRTRYGFYLLKKMIDLRAPTAVDMIADKFQEKGIRPRIIVVDTLARHMPGSDELAKDMGAVLGNCSRLLELTDRGTVLVIHHPKKEDSEDPRGSGTLDGHADYSMVLKRFAGTGQMILKARYFKDFDEFEPIRLKLQSVRLDDGAAVPVVVEGDPVKPPETGEKEDQIIRCLVDYPGSSFGEIQHATGIPKSTLSRLLKKLTDVGLVIRDEHNRYSAVDIL